MLPPQIPSDWVGRRRSGGQNSDKLMLALSLFPANRKAAHRFAQDTLGYPRTYRTFLRDIEELDPMLVQYASGGKEALIKNRTYLSEKSLHRHHQWGLDSTKADIWVYADRGSRSFRPWITLIVDRFSGLILVVSVHEGDPTQEIVTQTIAAAASGGDWQESGAPFTGGLPVMITVDNGAANIAESVRQGCARFGLMLNLTTPRHPWQNGSAERAHKTMKQQFLTPLPGFTGAGSAISGDPRFSPAFAGKDKPRSLEGLLKFARFAQLAEEYRLKHNATCVGADGLTPNERFELDPTPLRLASEVTITSAMTVEGGLHGRHKQGIHFRGEYYMAPVLSSVKLRQRLRVRYLPTVRSWIEVFTEKGDYIGRLYRSSTLPADKRLEVLVDRNVTEKKAKKIDATASQYRRHLAAVADDFMDGEEPPVAPSLAEHAASGFTDPVDRDPLPVAAPTKRARKSRATANNASTATQKSAWATLNAISGVTIQ